MDEIFHDYILHDYTNGSHSMNIPLHLIVAAAENGVIGSGGTMPWHLPTDLKYFKEKTLNTPIIMGRKTWESIGGKALPKRSNIVVSRQKDLMTPGAILCASLKEAYHCAQKEAQKMGAEAIYIIGGGMLYQEALRQKTPCQKTSCQAAPHQEVLPCVEKIYLTQVCAHIEGDTYFPPISPDEFEKISVQNVEKEEKDTHEIRFIIWQRRHTIKHR